MKPSVDGAPQGPEGDGQWSLYKCWQSDEWMCPGCGTKILSGHGHQQIVVDYQDDAVLYQKSWKADEILINDC
jgi:hypothetical protein